MNGTFCDAPTGLRRCNKLALFRCAGCGRALCTQHAKLLSAYGGNSRVCAACYRRKYQARQRLHGMLRN